MRKGDDHHDDDDDDEANSESHESKHSNTG